MAHQLLAQAEQHQDAPNLWMNLSIAMQCLGQRELGLTIQGQALEMQRVYELPATLQPSRFRLLVLMVPGDISSNTPLDCLLENSDISLIHYYVSSGDPLARPVPEHDAVFVAIGDSDANRCILLALEKSLGQWPAPVINLPQNIPTTGRNTASTLMNNAPGLLMPLTMRAPRLALMTIAEGHASLPEYFSGVSFPIILRPLGSQAGNDLDKIDGPHGISLYLSRVKGDEFFISCFIDYSGVDGLFRKFRIALIDGVPYACHMAVSSHWMVHYVNAHMYEDAGKRSEEAQFMEHFDAFVQRHRDALDAVYQRTGLDYFCIDCAETRDQQLFVFEVDHVMVVHDMDPVDLFPYKHAHVQKMQDAFRRMLFERMAGAKQNGNALR